MANTQTTVPLFVANQVLTASQQNLSAGTGVPVFATTVTRDAAFGGSNKALAEGQLAYIEASNIVQYYDGAAWATVGPVSTSLSISIFNETQSSGTQGGTATSGSYVKRVLNTTDTNNISGCSLATSVVTLATSGTYYLQGIIPCWRTDGVKARLQNTTAGTTIALGTVGNSNTTDNSQNFATVQGYITTTVSTTIELQGRVTTTAAGSGAGRAVTFGDNEIYAQLFIIKVA
jgi:hypothetical protein